jgi:hypothetical protein
MYEFPQKGGHREFFLIKSGLVPELLWLLDLSFLTWHKIPWVSFNFPPVRCPEVAHILAILYQWYNKITAILQK